MWVDAQKLESQFHGNCVNSYNEETKQYIYAQKMGLSPYLVDDGGRIGWDIGNNSIIDFGGGPYSMLLKFVAAKKVVVDPGIFPDWVHARYKASCIDFKNIKAEDFSSSNIFDMGLIYNCLQHTEEPDWIANTMREICKEIFVFEWIDVPTDEMHLHTLTEEKLNTWFKTRGIVEDINQGPCVGRAWYANFKV